MSEQFPTSFEQEKEKIPTIGEINSLVDLFANKKEVKQKKVHEDGQGIYLAEFTVAGDIGGEMTEFNYMRKGHHEKGGTMVTSLEAVYFDKDGIPFCSDTLANHINGEWVFTKEGEIIKNKI
jgi:hypothetical protein